MTSCVRWMVANSPFSLSLIFQLLSTPLIIKFSLIVFSFLSGFQAQLSTGFNLISMIDLKQSQFPTAALNHQLFLWGFHKDRSLGQFSSSFIPNLYHLSSATIQFPVSHLLMTLKSMTLASLVSLTPPSFACASVLRMSGAG